MSRGWSVRVVSQERVGGVPAVEWYYVAEAESDKAVQAVRALVHETGAQVEAIRPLPVILLKGQQLKPGEVTHVYRRGLKPTRAAEAHAVTRLDEDAPFRKKARP